MGIRQLTTFSEVARTGSFIQAAKALGDAQPTVSTHIQLLEKELGVRHKKKRGWFLTQS